MLLAILICGLVSLALYWCARCQWIEKRCEQLDDALSKAHSRHAVRDQALRSELTRMHERERQLAAQIERLQERTAYRG